MNCKCASYDPDSGRWQCSVSGNGCMFLIPNSKACAILYSEGPDADRDKAELLAELETEERIRKRIRSDTDDDCMGYDFDDEE